MASQTFNRPYSGTTYKPTGGIQATQSGTVLERNRDDKSALVKTPKGHWRPPTAYSRWIEQGDVYTLRFAKDYKEQGFHYVSSGYNDCSGFWYRAIDSAPSYLEDLAITQALLKLKSMQVNLAQNIGEREQTARLVFDNFKKVAGLIKNTRRTAVKIAKDPFALWLEIQYGWKPLLSDVFGLTKAILDAPAPPRIAVHGRARDNFGHTATCSIGRTSPTVYVDRLAKGVHNVHVRLDYEQSGNIAALNAASMGLTNPADLAWELLPFSFVADWASNIGDCFNVLDATVGWDFKGGSCSTMSRMNYKATNPRLAPNQSGYVGSSSVAGSARIVKFSRKVYGSSPLPERPHFNDRSSSMHVANGIALIHEAFKGKVGRIR